jgi:L-threonylcarbamoyladenylate synthase
VLHNTSSPWHRTLSVDATNEVAIQKVLSMKHNVLPLESMVIVQDEKMLEDYICPLPSFVKQFMHSQDRYVTVVHPFANHLALSACNQDGSVAVRMIPSIDTPPIQMSRHILRLL